MQFSLYTYDLERDLPFCRGSPGPDARFPQDRSCSSAAVQVVFILWQANWPCTGWWGLSCLTYLSFKGMHTSAGAYRRQEIGQVVDSRMTWTLVRAAVCAVLLAGAGLLGTEPASAANCGAQCKQAFNQCRISTKGSPSCDKQFTKCMQGCIKRN